MRKDRLLHHSRLIVSLLLVFALLSVPLGTNALSQDQRRVLDSGARYFNVEETAVCSGGVSGPGVSELEGHRLPASRGGAGFEEPIDERGRVPSTGNGVAFSGYAALGQEYRDYYITMRWRYATWNWQGLTQPGPEDGSWYQQAEPRKVLVTNPATGKSIIAAVLEAGPAPWTGSSSNNSSDVPDYWQGYVDGTPAGYDGRVAGFPPKAVEALGMEQWVFGGPNSSNPRGGGHELLYSWAPDQNARPGPTTSIAGGSPGTNTGPACGGGELGISPDGFVFPLLTTKSAIREGHQGTPWCYEQTNNCHHDYEAADIFQPPGTTVVAARGGQVVSARNRIGGAGSNISIRGDDGLLYYYTHMANGSVTLSQGDTVSAGDPLGEVGVSDQAMDTTPHLHIDALPSEYTARPNCTAGECTVYPFINIQAALVPAFEALPE